MTTICEETICPNCRSNNNHEEIVWHSPYLEGEAEPIGCATICSDCGYEINFEG